MSVRLRSDSSVSNVSFQGCPPDSTVARPEMTLRARPCISATASEGTRHSVDLPAYSKTTVALRRPTSFKKELAPMRWRARADISVTMRARSMRFKGPGTDSGAAPGALTLFGLGEDPGELCCAVGGGVAGTGLGGSSGAASASLLSTGLGKLSDSPLSSE